MNNYCLRRIRYALNLNDKALLDIFALASYKLTPSELKNYLLKEEQKGYVELPDYLLIIFLDGLIISKRGLREGEEPLSQAERVTQSKRFKLNNNTIVNKIKIALSLNTDALISMLELADFRVSKSEMSAFFRKPDHRNYRECGNQLLRNLLTGMTNHFHSSSNKAKETKKTVPSDKVKSKAKQPKSKVATSKLKSKPKPKAKTNKHPQS